MPSPLDPAGGVSERFRAAARDALSPAAGPIDLLPTRLATATAVVLGCDAAGLSLFADDFRVPLGASSPEAALAERLQFSAQQGPCWEAVRLDIPLTATADQIARQWPRFAEDLFTRTGLRSTVSVPLRLARRTGGALDLFFVDDAGADRFDAGDATAVAAHVADILNRAAEVPDDATVPPSGAPTLDEAIDGGLAGPRWASGPAARARSAVWMAAGLVLDDRVPGLGDAVDLLRAAAYAEGVTLDEVAADLVGGRRDPDSLRP